MNAEKLIHILNNKSSLDHQDVQGLEAMLKDYPYFLTPALLLTKHYARVGDYRYDALLQQTALLVHDREWLYEYMDDDEVLDQDEDQEMVEDNDGDLGLGVMGSNFEVSFDENIEGEEVEFENSQESAEVINSLEEVNSLREANSEEEVNSLREANSEEELNSSDAYNSEEKIKNAELNKSAEVLSLKMGRQIEMDTEEAEPLARPNFVRQAAVYDIELYYSGDSQSAQVPIEKGDFLAWLDHPKPVKEGNEVNQETKKHKSSELIDKFIQTNPGISKPKKEFFKPELVAKKSEQMPVALASETLAKIYIQQGNYNGAIEMYERLILKNPQKKPFFAGLIEKIKKEHLT